MNKEEMLKELRRTNENYPPAYKTLESVSKVMLYVAIVLFILGAISAVIMWKEIGFIYKGLKQKSVAEKAGYSQQQFSNLLTGRKFFGANDVLRIAMALKVTPNELFGINNETKSA